MFDGNLMKGLRTYPCAASAEWCMTVMIDQANSVRCSGCDPHRNHRRVQRERREAAR